MKPYVHHGTSATRAKSVSSSTTSTSSSNSSSSLPSAVDGSRNSSTSSRPVLRTTTSANKLVVSKSSSQPSKIASSLAAFESSTSSVLSNLTQRLSSMKEESQARDAKLYECWMRKFKIGTLDVNSASLVTFYKDRVTYKIQHPAHGKVSMKMYYADFTEAVLKSKSRSLVFRVNHLLEFFHKEYDLGDTSQKIVITFDKESEFEDFENDVIPVMQTCFRPGQCTLSLE